MQRDVHANGEPQLVPGNVDCELSAFGLGSSMAAWHFAQNLYYATKSEDDTWVSETTLNQCVLSACLLTQ